MIAHRTVTPEVDTRRSTLKPQLIMYDITITSYIISPPEAELKILYYIIWYPPTMDEDREPGVIHGLGTLRWFGPTWNAAVNDPRTEIPIPVGVLCPRDDLPIQDGDSGISIPFHERTGTTRIYYHLSCWFRELGLDPDTGKFRD